MVWFRDLTPGKFVLFTKTLVWKLLGYGKACERGTGTQVHFSSRYTCPEMLLALDQKAETIIAKPSADMWALGLLFWEVLTGNPLLGQKYCVTEVSLIVVFLWQSVLHNWCLSGCALDALCY